MAEDMITFPSERIQVVRPTSPSPRPTSTTPSTTHTSDERRRQVESDRRQRHREERGHEEQRTDPNFTDRMLGLFNSIFKTYVKPELDETLTMNTRLQDKSFVIKLPVLAIVYLFNSNLFFFLYLLTTINMESIPERTPTPTPPREPITPQAVGSRN